MSPRPRLLLLTPPLVQTNCPYPATMHLTGFLRGIGCAVEQRDLSIKVALDVLRKFGDETTDELIEILQNPCLSAEEKRGASEIIDELALQIRDTVDGEFGFSRYAERASAFAPDFTPIERLVRKRGVLDEPLERHLEAAIRETRPTIVGVACPFPGTLVAAFKVARYVRRRYPHLRTVLGGGFVTTELREMNDPRPRKYFDDFIFDEGYEPMARLLGKKSVQVPAFICPDYDGIDLGEYFDVVETDNPMTRLWSCGRWLKLVMARGCYWHKCAFCDVKLPYIGCFKQPPATEVVDAMQFLVKTNPNAEPLFHFADEAMPPALVRSVCEEIIRRKFSCRFWGNVRFDKSWNRDLTRLMARAGCIAVTGGLECADDRLLSLMNKGITLASARKSLKAFHSSGIRVHAYLMFGFPTQTKDETLRALEYVRDLFREDLIQSAYYHRFALTIHSPIAADPMRFGLVIGDAENGERRTPKSRQWQFARNEIGFVEANSPDLDRLGRTLRLAIYNYIEGRGLEKSADYWYKKA